MLSKNDLRKISNLIINEIDYLNDLKSHFVDSSTLDNILKDIDKLVKLNYKICDMMEEDN